MKKIVAFSLALLLVFLLTSCAEKSSTGPAASGDSAFAGIKSQSWYSGEKKFLDPLSEEKGPDVQSIYDNMEYNELLLCGKYKLDNKDKDLKKLIKTTSFMELEFYNQAADNPKTMTVDVMSVPYEVIAGARNIKCQIYREIYYPLVNKNEENWAILHFSTEEAKYAEVLCTYEVSGKQVTYTPVEFYEASQNEDGEYVDCTYTLGKKTLTYTFDFMGPYFSLKNETDSILLCSHCFCSESKSEPSFWAYALPDSPLISNLVTGMSGALAQGELKNGDVVWNLSFKFDSNGLATIAWTDTYGISEGPQHTFSKQVVYWVTGVGALFHNQFVFADENNLYYYSDDYALHETRQLQDYLTEDELNAVSSEKLEALEKQKRNLFDDLTKAFEEAGISVTVDLSLGEIALDNTVLFAGDNSTITPEGKALLKKFVNAYGSVVFDEENAEKIKSVMIEGHTAPLSGSTYESGLPLSQERANNVKECCMSDEMALPAAVSERFKASLETRGMSNSRPVYDSDGNVDLDACRRVSFVFVLDIDKL